MWIQINTDDETIIIPNVRRYCKVSTTVPTVPTAVTTAVTTMTTEQRCTRNIKYYYYIPLRDTCLHKNSGILFHDFFVFCRRPHTLWPWSTQPKYLQRFFIYNTLFFNNPSPCRRRREFMWIQRLLTSTPITSSQSKKCLTSLAAIWMALAAVGATPLPHCKWLFSSKEMEFTAGSGCQGKLWKSSCLLRGMTWNQIGTWSWTRAYWERCLGASWCWRRRCTWWRTSAKGFALRLSERRKWGKSSRYRRLATAKTTTRSISRSTCTITSRDCPTSRRKALALPSGPFKKTESWSNQTESCEWSKFASIDLKVLHVVFFLEANSWIFFQHYNH